MGARVRFDLVKVGDEIPPLAKVVRRDEVEAFADAYGDPHPLHRDDMYARDAGLPGIIAPGPFSMSHLTKAVTDWLGDPGALKRMKVEFRAMVFMDETMVARGRIQALDEKTKRARLALWVEVVRGGEPHMIINNAEAEVDLG